MLALRFLFVEIWNSGLSRFRSLSSKDSPSSLSHSLLFKMMAVFACVSLANVSMYNFVMSTQNAMLLLRRSF